MAAPSASQEALSTAVEREAQSAGGVKLGLAPRSLTLAALRRVPYVLAALALFVLALELLTA
ncbi:MAG: hypothetical protein IIB87_08525, partial [Chloroflexi bacterium]|nr:hypothetical protein [Chloroflexota bacterium]